MIIFKRISDLRNHLQTLTAETSVGFVPTMGALHEGHLQLIDAAGKGTDLVVASIFVNPTQFNDPKDFEKYPITIEGDIELLLNRKCDILFLPTVTEMYPNGLQSTKFYNLGNLEEVLEGYYRPGHFQGVSTIVDKLLNIVQPQQLFMGQKDFQQCMVVNRLLQQKYPRTTLAIVPTVREPDGLAMSSRNVRLSPEGREKAVILSQVLKRIVDQIAVTTFEQLTNEGKKTIMEAGFSSVDYLEICFPETLQTAKSFDSGQQYVVLVAAFLENVRLIDNMLT